MHVAHYCTYCIVCAVSVQFEACIPNPFTNVEVHFIFIVVLPVITIPPDDQTVLSPEVASFNCSSTGKPRVDMYWIDRDNVLINDTTDKYILSTYTIGNCTITDPPSQCVSSSTLQILNTRTVDSGEYTCVVTNEVGNYSSSTILIVNGEHCNCIQFY